MKKLLFIVLLLCIKQVNAQTNVSGGIYSNTTWSLTNSPYILTDTVVVFPGVTLTIQPGVVVKFDANVQLEVRQAKLIALGNSIDSITFTSNASSPTPGVYSGIFLNGGNLVSQFNYCNFRYAASALSTNNIPDTLTVKNSNVIFNQYGIYSVYTSIKINSCNFRNNTASALSGDGLIGSCNFSNNGVGISGGANFPSIVTNCNLIMNQTGIKYVSGPVLNCMIKYNQIGLNCIHYTKPNNCVISNNQIGVNIWGENDTVRNCIIDSNSTVGIKLYGEWACVTNCQIKYNGVGIIDSIGVITGGINSITKNDIENNGIGIVLSTDSDNISCNKICNNISYALKYMGTNNTHSITNNYWCTDSTATEVAIYDGYDNTNYGLAYFMPIDSACYFGTTTNITNLISSNNKVNFYPNPTSDQLFIDANSTDKLNVDLYDVNGRHVFSANVMDKSNINVSSLNEGVYTMTIKTADRVTNKKLIILR